jgi:hypothetical protein
MRKLRLDLDALAVESFDTEVRGFGRGTIAGNRYEANPAPFEGKETQSNCDDCHYTLPPTCLSCDADVCTMASKTECPSCVNSCNGCGPTCACPV